MALLEKIGLGSRGPHLAQSRQLVRKTSRPRTLRQPALAGFHGLTPPDFGLFMAGLNWGALKPVEGPGDSATARTVLSGPLSGGVPSGQPAVERAIADRIDQVLLKLKQTPTEKPGSNKGRWALGLTGLTMGMAAVAINTSYTALSMLGLIGVPAIVAASWLPTLVLGGSAVLFIILAAAVKGKAPGNQRYLAKLAEAIDGEDPNELKYIANSLADLEVDRRYQTAHEFRDYLVKLGDAETASQFWTVYNETYPANARQTSAPLGSTGYHLDVLLTVTGEKGDYAITQDPGLCGGMGKLMVGTGPDGREVAVKFLMIDGQELSALPVSADAMTLKKIVGGLIRFEREYYIGTIMAESGRQHTSQAYDSNIYELIPELRRPAPDASPAEIDQANQARDEFVANFGQTRLKALLDSKQELFFVGKYFRKPGTNEPAEQLADIIEHGIDIERAFALLSPIMEDLAFAHERGYYHRDLKPQNILITSNDGGEKIAVAIDWGIMKDVLDLHAETASDALIGTMEYMAPESYKQWAIGHGNDYTQTEIYTMAVILLECKRGENPLVVKGNPEATKNKRLAVVFGNAPVDLTPANLPLPLEEVMAKALSINPENNFRTMREFHDALQSVIAPVNSGRSAEQQKTAVDEASPIKALYDRLSDPDRRQEALEEIAACGGPAFDLTIDEQRSVVKFLRGLASQVSENEEQCELIDAGVAVLKSNVAEGGK